MRNNNKYYLKILTIIFLTATLICCQNNKQKNYHYQQQNINHHEQEKIIHEIKSKINNIDVDNNVINNEQKRLQSCQTLINEINAYQNNQELYQLLLPLQKTLIIKQKLIRHYHQSLSNKIITIIINVMTIIFIAFFITMIVVKHALYFAKKTNVKNYQIHQQKIVNLISFPILIIFVIFLNYFVNMLFNNNNERLFNNIINLFDHHTSKIKINKCLFINEKQVSFFLYDHSMYLINNKQKYYYVPLLFDDISNWFLTSCHVAYILFFIIAIILIEYIFNTEIKRIIFNMKTFFKPKINSNFPGEKIGIIKFHDNYDKVYKLAIKKLFLTQKVKTLKNNENENLLIQKTIDEFENNEEKKKKNEMAFAYYCCYYLIINNENINVKKSSLLFNKIIQNNHDDSLFQFMYISFCVIFFLLQLILFDYAHTFSHRENNQQPHFLTIIFYWQHCFNELIKNIFKALPIINNRYFMQPSQCKFWYPIILLLIHPLVIIINLFLFGFLKIFFKGFINKIIGDFNDKQSLYYLMYKHITINQTLSEIKKQLCERIISL